MKLFNPYSQIKELGKKISELEELILNLKLTMVSKKHTITMAHYKVACLQKELKGLKQLNNKLIGEKMQLQNRLNCFVENN
jgi:predicted RNase H-like nuclease (RuvC/YqgF family)